ncbi:putative chromatin regulator PHD family [Lupinus albus]|uniref:Putative chromatin regulator PHD family n=1 Tax=Lupinus albus TaxID=3870 RepID=A0A6A4P930_LUPAL|nr:putative chromatin regulator PHD family [Lupinus albus]
MFMERDFGTQGMPLPTEFSVPVTTRPEISEHSGLVLEIDCFAQARKALSLRCPFDDKDENWSPTKATLPSGLAAFLNQGSDNRKKRRRKSHSNANADKKNISKTRGPNIWTETEEYFRDLALPDIDTLFDASSLPSSLVARECFSIPVVKEPGPRDNVVVSSENENGNNENADIVAVKNEDGFVGIDSVNDKVDSVNGKDQATYDTSDCAVSLEWVLGCRNKVSLTSERPSKKRKVLGDDAGLEKVLITTPHDGNLSYCHYCGRGDSGLESNRLVVCGSCKVAVHRKCYGVQGDVDDGSWLCSWCERMDDISETVNPCVLCPNKGGALKPINISGEGAQSLQFAHLFCCLWTPEIYVDDLKKMDPVMDMGGIEECRRKLVCNICKVKSGACVRCSHGPCRLSFHPLCAREARQRMEVWAKDCSDNVELRAFCFKHSDFQEKSSILQSGDSVAIGSEFSDASVLQVSFPVNSENNLKRGCRNRDNVGTISDGSPDNLSHNEPEDGRLSISRLNAHNMLECDAEQQLYNIGTVGRSNENANASDTLKYALVWKKLIERGKIDVKDVALKIGIAPEELTPNIYEACMAPDVRLKIVNWLKDHVYTNACHKGSKVKFKPASSSKDEDGATDGSDTSLISDPGLLDPVAVMSVGPPRKRAASNIRILKDNVVTCSSEAVSSENGMPMDKCSVGEPDCGNTGTSNEVSIPEVSEKNLTTSEDTLPEVQGCADKVDHSSLAGCISDETLPTCLSKPSTPSEHYLPVCSNSEVPDSGSKSIEATSCYVHPYISKELLQLHNSVLSEDIICPRRDGNSSLVESLRASGHSGNQHQQLTGNEHLSCLDDCKSDQMNMEQLVRAREMGVFEYSPEDEVEGELIYFQHRLLQNAVRRRQIADNLVFSVAKSLPKEIDTAHQQMWDAVLVNQYMYDLRETKKRGRKERKHKEAQAVLAAATAAAAAPRVSSFRKDSLAESMQQENLIKLDTLSGRAGVCSQTMPRAKETLSRLAVIRTSSEKHSDFSLSSSNLSKEHPGLCDVCRQPETLSNTILVCSSCKVAVHLDCYGSVKETTGPWYCDLCGDLSSRNSGASAINSVEKPYLIAECALCCGSYGAFKKSSDGQWIHAFCAEWIFESTFRRGQVNAVEGVETVLKEVDICCICCHKRGVCIKCSFGNCQTKFHPSCARNAGFYMNMSTAAGKPHKKPHHKAYCEKHGSEQRAKVAAEAQKHGMEELKSFRQIRVELERLRLLCERVIRREKIKRELVLCSQDMLAFKRDHVARSVLAQRSFILPGGSSESATTSLKVNTEGNRSCSEVVQRSDDVTVDSSVPDKHHVGIAVSMDTDPKLDDDCSTSPSNYNHKIPERLQYFGKKIPQRASAISHKLDDGGWRSKSRKSQHADTFGKELVMTSDEASMKNSMLPKGYAYVPADCLSNDDIQPNQDVDANGSVEHDR